ncbi:MAG: hypothetical protein H0V68_01805 [Actinobacteria bacterium]|nr:hypothetical protein [Actinomycetota bacterium]
MLRRPTTGALALGCARAATGFATAMYRETPFALLRATGVLEPAAPATDAVSRLADDGIVGSTTPVGTPAAGSRPYATATNAANATSKSAKAAGRPPPLRLLVPGLSP